MATASVCLQSHARGALLRRRVSALEDSVQSEASIIQRQSTLGAVRPMSSRRRRVEERGVQAAMMLLDSSELLMYANELQQREPILLG